MPLDQLMLPVVRLAAAALVAAAAPGARTFDAAPDSTLSYRLVHRFHAVTGVSHAVEGKARVLPDGTLQVEVRAPLRSFDSGNRSRDANMLEATRADRNPNVLLKAVGRLAIPASYPAEQRVALHGELTLNTARPVDVPVTVTFESPDRARVQATFPVSLDAHHVERPSLLFVKVDDRVVIEAKLTMQAEGDAPRAAGPPGR